MSPFGGEPSRRADFSDEPIQALGRFFRHGEFLQEVVETYISRNLAVLVLIERQRVEVGGLPMQDWPLRVTLVYKRTLPGRFWQLAHRHADSLTNQLDLQTAGALARGEGPKVLRGTSESAD